MLGKLVLTYTVNLVVRAWDDPGMNTKAVTEPALESFFHPDFYNPQSQIQYQMMTFMKDWIAGQQSQGEVLRRLTKAAVQKHENTRLHTGGHDGGVGYNLGTQAQHELAHYAQGIPGVSQVQGAYNSFQRISGQISQFTGAGSGPRRELDDNAPVPHPPVSPPASFPSQAFPPVSPVPSGAAGFQEQYTPGYQHPAGSQPPPVTSHRPQEYQHTLPSQPPPITAPRPEPGEHEGLQHQGHHGQHGTHHGHPPHAGQSAQPQGYDAPQGPPPFPAPMGAYEGPQLQQSYGPPQGPPGGQWQGGYAPPPGQYGPPPGVYGPPPPGWNPPPPPQGWNGPPPPGWQGGPPPPPQGWTGYPGQGRW